MPDRLIRDSILDSDSVNALSFGAEILYRRIMSIADDYGRYEARVTALKGKCFPVRPKDDITNDLVAGWLGEIRAAGLIVYYTVDGKDYLEIKNFRQRLRTMKSKYPGPQAADSAPPTDDGQLPVNSQAPAVEEKRSEEGREEKRNEEKGGEEGAGAPPPAPPSPPPSSGDGKLKEKQAAMRIRRTAFHAEVTAFAESYPEPLLTAFYAYWSESNKSQTKMRFEMEKTWVLSMRLSTWEKKDHEFRRRGPGSGGGPPPEKHVTGEEVEYLYQRFLEGAVLKEIVQEKHCDFLLQAGLIQLAERFIHSAALWRAKQLMGTNNAAELRMIAAYYAGTWSTDLDCKTDEPNRTRIAKKLALIDYFQKAKASNRKTITDNDGQISA